MTIARPSISASSRIACAALFCAASPVALAQDALDATDAPVERRIHFSAGAEVTNAYFFRGFRQEDRGFIFQPHAELSFGLASWSRANSSATSFEQWTAGNGDASNSLDLVVGIWNSIHSETDTAQSPDGTNQHWYEADFYVGPSVTLGAASLSLVYTMYSSPSDAFATVEEFILTFGWDDADHGLLFGMPVAPTITLAFEIDDDTSDGQDPGVALELGVAPGFAVDAGALSGLEITFPITLGLSLSDYYQDASGDDETFGYFGVGIAGSIPLPLGPEWGEWALSAGVDVLFLGDTTKAFNDGDDTQFVATLGIGVSFSSSVDYRITASS